MCECTETSPQPSAKSKNMWPRKSYSLIYLLGDGGVRSIQDIIKV